MFYKLFCGWGCVSQGCMRVRVYVSQVCVRVRKCQQEMHKSEDVSALDARE